MNGVKFARVLIQVGLFERAVSELYNYGNLAVEAVHLGVALNGLNLLKTRTGFLA